MRQGSLPPGWPVKDSTRRGQRVETAGHTAEGRVGAAAVETGWRLPANPTGALPLPAVQPEAGTCVPPTPAPPNGARGPAEWALSGCGRRHLGSWMLTHNQGGRVGAPGLTVANRGAWEAPERPASGSWAVRAAQAPHRRLPAPREPSAGRPRPHSLDRVVAGEGDEAPEGQREGVEDLRSRFQPGHRIGQFCNLKPDRDSQPGAAG